ncbi:MAG: HD domain-containing protein [Candidatus Pacebacteria bacterium]|jgi:hypothetical protein|nr:HD domain-containing protein [Candidatus Paceibacterota bacterium]
MSRIEEIYETYDIMPTLREHMYRVAAVASVICDSLSLSSKEKQEIVIACLLHDMGNLIKFRLGDLPQLLAPKGLIYWQSIQEVWKQKYGTDEHLATRKIAEELGVSDRILMLVDSIGFPNGKRNLLEADISKMIAGYADMRVSPYGVRPLLDRLDDLQKRYKDKSNNEKESQQELIIAFTGIEKYIFANASISPEMITEEAITVLLPELKSVTIAS